MARKKKETTPTVCGTCMRPVVREALDKALREGTEYVCECGRVLVKAR